MKIRVEVPARVSSDRKRCMRTCNGHYGAPPPTDYCAVYMDDLKLDHLSRPLRCRACVKGEVKP